MPVYPRMSADDMITKYIRLRDKVKEIKARQSEELRPFGEAMAMLEGWMLESMNTQGSSR